MKECWELEAEKRPTFSEIVSHLSTYLESFVSYVKLVDEDISHQCNAEVHIGRENNPVVVLTTSSINETIM